MYNRNYTRTESFQDLIARLYPATELSPEVRERVLFDKDGNEKRYLARTCTFQVTDACNLCCTYCYQINKKTHIMDFETAKKFADMILDANMENNPYIDVETSPGIVFEFIGGEPFMAIDLIQQISDYIVDKMIKTNHPWMNKFMFSICSNGVLYMNEKVQAYMNKYKYNLSFSISIDGNKELHDKCRIFPDGRGSYDIAIAGVEHFRKH